MPNLQEPILDGIKSINYFNGRLLTERDMREEQSANRQEHARLGKALGTGVVSGLEVTLKTANPPVLSVDAGCAVNLLGQMLELRSDQTQIALTVQPESDTADDAGLFSDCCRTVSASLGSGTASGVFILTIAPTSDYEGRAPKHEPFDAGGATGCGRRYVVEGVRFNLVAVTLNALSENEATRESIAGLIAATGSAEQSRLRNLLAHACLGTEDVARFARDPFAGSVASSPNEYGAVDRLREVKGGQQTAALTECEVPLALIFWTGAGVQFVDMWAVRRLLFSPDDSVWSSLVGSRRKAEGRASFQQFQLHVNDLLQTNAVTRAQIAARDNFRYLPTVGLVPITSDNNSAGLSRTRFFSGMTVPDPVTIEGRQLLPLLEESYLHGATDLGEDAEAPSELHWLYTVRENVSAGSGEVEPQQYIVFANALLPYRRETLHDARVVLLPIADPVRVRSEIVVRGAGFLVPARLNDLFIDDIQITAFNPGSSATRFVFNVPEIPGLTGVRSGILSVRNANGAASTPITILPEAQEIPEGQLVLTLLNTPSGSIREGDTLIFEFLVDSQTNIAETYALSVLYINAEGASEADWQSATEIRTISGATVATVIASSQHPATVQLHVVVPSGAQRVDFRFRATSVNNPQSGSLTQTTSPIALEVGQGTETSDPRVRFAGLQASPQEILVEDPGLGTLLDFTSGTEVVLRATAEFTEAGEYLYAATFRPAGAAPQDWSVAVTFPTGPTSEVAGGEQNITFRVTAPSPNTNPSLQVELRVSRVGVTPFESWQRIPVRAL